MGRKRFKIWQFKWICIFFMKSFWVNHPLIPQRDFLSDSFIFITQFRLIHKFAVKEAQNQIEKNIRGFTIG